MVHVIIMAREKQCEPYPQDKDGINSVKSP
jgi:hypothetical protein